MSERKIEERFARFAANGDTEEFAVVFDALAPKLLAVAKRLTRDRAAAEDVTQATWLAAIEAAPRFDATRSLQAWLIGILVRQARLAQRRERTSANDAALDLLPGSPHVDELEARDTREFVARTIARLSPSDRLVLEPWILDERGADELALELAARPDTVRMRIHRGLDRLRHLLATGLGIGLAIAWLDRRTLARTKERIMQAARSPSAVLAPSIGASLAVSKLAVVLALVAVTTIAVATSKPWHWFANSQSAPAIALAEPNGNASTISNANSASTPTIPDPQSRTRVAASAPPNANAQAPTQWLVVGKLSGAPNGDESAAIQVTTFFDELKPQALIVGNSAADGSYSIDVSSIFASGGSVTKLSVMANHPLCVLKWITVAVANGVLVTANGVTRLEMHADFALTPAAIVRGRVQLAAEDDSSWCESALFAATPNGPNRNHDDSQSFKPSEEFRLRAKSSGKVAIYVLTARSAPVTRIVDVVLGQVSDVGTLDLSIGAAIHGTVDPKATDPSKWITAVRRKGEFGWGASMNSVVWTNNAFSRLAEFSSIDEQGTFAFSGLDASEYELVLLPKPATSNYSFSPTAGTGKILVTAPASGVQLGSSGSILEVSFAPNVAAPDHASVMVTKLYDGSGSGAPLSADQTAKWTLLPGVDYRVVCSAHGWSDFSTTLHAPPAGQTVLQPVTMHPLTNGNFHWKLVDGNGKPITDVAFGFMTSSAKIPLAMQIALDSPPIRRQLHNDQGQFDILDVPIDEYTVRVHAGSSYHDPKSFQQSAEFSLHGNSDDARTIQLALGGKLRIAVTTSTPLEPCGDVSMVDSQGAALSISLCHWIGEQEMTIGASLQPGGTSDLVPNLAPGDYTLTITRPGFADKKLTAKIEAGKATELTFDADAP